MTSTVALGFDRSLLEAFGLVLWRGLSEKFIILIQPRKLLGHMDHEFGGPSLCLAVLHLATAEDRFSWGVLALRVNVHGWRQGKITGAEK